MNTANEVQYENECGGTKWVRGGGRNLSFDDIKLVQEDE